MLPPALTPYPCLVCGLSWTPFFPDSPGLETAERLVRNGPPPVCLAPAASRAHFVLISLNAHFSFNRWIIKSSLSCINHVTKLSIAGQRRSACAGWLFSTVERRACRPAPSHRVLAPPGASESHLLRDSLGPQGQQIHLHPCRTFYRLQFCSAALQEWGPVKGQSALNSPNSWLNIISGPSTRIDRPYLQGTPTFLQGHLFQNLASKWTTFSGYHENLLNFLMLPHNSNNNNKKKNLCNFFFFGHAA